MSREVGVTSIAGTIVAVLVAVFSVVGSSEQAEQLATLLVTVPALVLIAAGIFFLVVPRAVGASATPGSNRPAVLGLVCGVLGLLLVVPVYWSGLPILLGTGGFVLGQSGWELSRDAGRGGLALGAMVIGAAAILLDLAFFFPDRFF